MQHWDSWSVRVVLLGDSMVGKSTLVLRAAGRPLPSPLAPTIGIDYDRADVTVEGEKFSLQLWDTAGQERFRSIVDGYYRGAACLLAAAGGDLSPRSARPGCVASVRSQLDGRRNSWRDSGWDSERGVPA